MKRVAVLRIALCFFGFLGVFSAASARADSGFMVKIGGIKSTLSLVSTTSLPGGSVTIQTTAHARSDAGTLEKTAGGWNWTAPTALEGQNWSDIVFSHENRTSIVRVFLLTPFDSQTQKSLNGFRIGQYRSAAYRGLETYLPPVGFIDATHTKPDTPISPRFTLAQFLCKQQPGHEPAYLLIDARLLIKLETVLDAANAAGWPADTLTVMSGFRTPHYNAAIGNRSSYSRHLFGDGADVFIDHDGDGRMDDLDGNGRINKDDARALARLVASLSKREENTWPIGGLGVYGSNQFHGPFVHIDARGYPARWGQ